MKNLRFLILTALLSVCFSSHAAKHIVLTAPADYQLMAVSPNGKWACGVYMNYSSAVYAFRWSLESGSIEMLSTSGESIAWGVSNDGTVSGTFSDTELNPNGATIEVPGFYKDGKWTRVEIPSGATVASGGGYGITPDGHYMSGYLYMNNVYVPYIWKDGKIYRQLSDKTGMPYTIAPDGQSAAGWEDGPVKKNRIPTYWKADGTTVHLTDYESAWSAGKKFSSDGNKLLLWGGWEVVGGKTQVLSVYDVATGNIDRIPSLIENASMDFFDISNKYTVVGDESGRAYINIEGQGYYVEDYLKAQGVDLSGYGIMEMNGVLALTSARAISADDGVLGLLYYDTEGSMRSMIVFLKEEAAHRAPVEIKGTQLEGIGAVRLNWSAPLGAEAITGYNVYRGNTKINSSPLTSCRFYDKNLASGNYSYSVSSVYGDGTEMKSEPVTVSVLDKQLSTPQALFTRQRGFNGAYMEWSVPATNLIGKSYYDMEASQTAGFGANSGVSGFEVAIGYDKEEIECYAGCKLTEVSFYPMGEQSGWAVNVYTRGTNGALSLIASQPVSQTLKYRERNTVKFDNPVTLPDGDLIIAVSVTLNRTTNDIIGTDFSHGTAGYSDLLRQASENDFYSLYSASLPSGNPLNVTWKIDAVFAPEGASSTSDAVDHYNVYADNSKLGETKDLSYRIDNIAEGRHAFSVDAAYADGKVSGKTVAEMDIVNDYKGIDIVYVKADGNNKITATWQEPADDDKTQVSYAYGTAQSSAPKGPASANYAITAAVDITPSKLKGYDGYQVRSFRFYPIADALFTFMVQENGEQIYELEVDDYKLNEWNTVELPSSITVNSSSTYKLILDCYDVTPGMAPLAIDNTVPSTFFSDLYSLNSGESWSSFSLETGLSGNWMLGWTMASQDSKPLAVDGYDVNIDGVKRNSSVLTAPKFDWTFATDDGKQHSISVDVYYPAKSVSVKGDRTYFYIATAGISENVVSEINVRYGENYIKAEGEGVKSVAVYAADGAELASAQGNTLNVSGLGAGVYIVKVNVSGKSVVRKIKITK